MCKKLLTWSTKNGTPTGGTPVQFTPAIRVTCYEKEKSSNNPKLGMESKKTVKKGTFLNVTRGDKIVVYNFVSQDKGGKKFVFGILG